MALETLELLVNGDENILGIYKKAKEHWVNILSNFDWNTTNSKEEMARVANIHQFTFEQMGNDNSLGQEVMVITGILQFYSSEEGFSKNVEKAKTVYYGFLQSNCSIGVKHFAKEIGKIYELID